ncbi:hypothetical protein ACWDAO_30550, partial [Streptomyces sp. NPDC001212]
MTGPDVPRDGAEGARPGRAAPIGAGAGRGRHRRRRGRGEQSMVPEARFSSYYGRPVLKRPTWKSVDIAGYLYLGGREAAAAVAGFAGTVAVGALVLPAAGVDYWTR